MCGCECCCGSDPTCFDPQSMEANGSFHGWACRCPCPGCIARVIEGAVAYGRRKASAVVGEEVDGQTSIYEHLGHHTMTCNVYAGSDESTCSCGRPV
jgi:hypothetical protein